MGRMYTIFYKMKNFINFENILRIIRGFESTSQQFNSKKVLYPKKYWEFSKIIRGSLKN